MTTDDFTSAPGEGGGEAAPLINPKQLLAGLLRHWWLVLVLPLLGAGIGWTVSRNVPRKYAATAVLQLDPGRRFIAMEGVDEINLKDEMEVSNLVQRATSRPTLLRAIKRQRYHFQQEWIGETAAGSEEAAVAVLRRLQSEVSAAVRKGTRYVDIRAVGESAEFVAEFANATALAAIEEMDADRGELKEEATEFLMKEAERLRGRLKASELALQAYKAENDAISLDEKKDLVLTTLKNIGEQYLQASARRLQLETELEACKKGDISETELLSISTVANHPKVAATMAELSRLGGEMEVLRQRYKPKHPKFIALQVRIDGAQARLNSFLGDVVGLLESSLAGMRSLEGKLEAQLKEHEHEALELEKLAVNYNSLRREMETDSAVFESVLARLKEVDVAQSQDRSLFRLHQSAEPPSLPYSPNIPMILGGSTAGGLALAVALVAGLVLIDSKIRTVADAERHFQLPILGVIAKVDGAEADTGADATASGSAEQPPPPRQKRRLRSYYYQQGNREAFRTLRNMVSLLGRKESTRTLVVTSANPEEGKTFCAANMAVSFASQGTPTLIVDADLRRPALGRHFPEVQSGGPGLSDVLLGNVDFSAAVAGVGDTDRLFYLSSGSRVPNPGELIGNEKMMDAFLRDVLAMGFEKVIFDSAPLLPVSDTLMLAARADTVLMVVACNQTPHMATRHALGRLNEVGVRVSGLILNKFLAHKSTGYYYNYYNSNYYGREPVTAS